MVTGWGNNVDIFCHAVKVDSMMRKRALLAGAIFWVVAPFVLIIVLTLISTGLLVNGSTQASWVIVPKANNFASRQVVVQIKWSDPPVLVSPNWSGLITKLSISNGATIKSGDTVVQVNGVDRIAWQSDVPFYRLLGLRTSGADVVALQSLLKSRGLPSDANGVFNAATKRGVNLFASQIGATEQDGIFHPEWIVFMPQPTIVVGKISMILGGRAPAGGDEILAGLPTPDSAVLSLGTGLPGDLGDSVVANPDESLQVGEIAVELSEDRRSVSAEGLSTLARITNPGDEKVVGTLTRRLNLGAVLIPTAAIHTDSEGKTCVEVKNEKGSKVVNVKILGGSGGQTYVTGEVNPGVLVGIGVFKVADQCN